MGTKTLNTGKAHRIEAIAYMIIEGMGRMQIFNTVFDKHGIYKWTLSERQVDADIAQARKLIQKNSGTTSKQEFRDIAIARYEDLYNKNYREGNFKEARANNEALTKLLGLNEAEKVDMTTNGESINTPFAEILKQAFIKSDDTGAV